jgi:hypothetical protein
MKRWALGLILMSINALAVTPVSRLTSGDALPPLRGEYLTGRPALLPQDASDRVALLLLGFTYDSRFAVEAWTKEFRHEFEKNPTVTFYEIPMIGGLARLGKWFIDSGMRKGTPRADQGNVITVYGGTDLWKQRVAFQDPNAAYLILIDQRGNVTWQYVGAFDQEAYKALAAQVSGLAGE